jgi:hypothetical protein
MSSETPPPPPELPKGTEASPIRSIRADDLSEIEFPEFTLHDISLVEGEAQKLDAAHARKKARAELKGLKQDIRARKRYARNIFTLIVCWLIAIFFVLLLQGFSGEKIITLSVSFANLGAKTSFQFNLANSVLLALIGGTTANVLGLFIFVVQQ